MTDFVHLHNHSEYSLLDGLTTPEEMAQITSTNGQTASAITDHGTMGGFIRFQQAAKKQNIKPIFGVEAYFVDDVNKEDSEDKRERYHLILLAKNDTGLSNLFRINKVAWTEQFYYKPLIDYNTIRNNSEGLICLSGCMGSALSQALMDGNEQRAENIVKRFSEMFPNDYYIEVQPHNPPDLNKMLIEYADHFKIPLVGTLDCHFPTAKDRGVEEVFLAMGQNSGMKAADKRHARDHFHEACATHDLVEKMDILYPDRRLSFKDLPLYMMGAKEVLEHFHNAGITRSDIMENTMEISDRCHAEIKMHQVLLPKYAEDIGLKMSSEDYLSEIAHFMLEQKGLSKNQEYVDRLNEELEIIINKKFSDYFLILWDLISWADGDGIARGPARGSAGGSLLSFVLGITAIDPVKFGLLFFRFINPERDDFPDIDLDFEDRRRDEAKEYLRQRWGADNVAGISAYTTFKAKGAIKGIASAFAVPYTEANNATNLFEDLDEYRSSEKLAEFRRKYPDIEKVAARLDGRCRAASAHAAGVVVSSVPIHDIAPIEMRTEAVTKRKIPVVAYDKDQCGELGLIKLDALSVRAITVVKDCLNVIKERHGLDVREQSVDIDNPDERVFEEFSAGNIVGIFQAEGAGYANLIQTMGVKNFSDLVASNALVRPGSYVTQGETYLAVRDGRQKPKYHHKILEDILGETYGTYIFEEQVMKIAVELAGFSWGGADRLRKIISKKKDQAEFDKYRDEFVTGASRYITTNQAEKLWKDIEKASLYMFNKSHATGYSLVSYQTMWLKVNYPLEFLWATLTNEIEAEKTSTYLFEARRLGIEILPPDANNSELNFTLDNEGLRFGLLNIAGLGMSAAIDIVEKRPFDSYEDFCERTASRSVKKNIIESLDKVGFFESLGWESEYEKERYFGPILSYHVNMNDESPFDDIIYSCSEASASKESTDMFVVRGVVKASKRTPKYFRVELEDASGVCSSFADKENAAINKRDYLITLIGDQTIHHYDDFYAVESGESQTPFAKFLRAQIAPGANLTPYDHMVDHGATYDMIADGSTPILGFVLNTVKFKTKSDVEMASLYIWNPKIGNVKIGVFGNVLESAKARYLEPFQWVLFKAKAGRVKGGKTLDNIISCEQFAINKGLKYWDGSKYIEP